MLKLVKKPVQNPDEMSFLDHLEALRWHLVRSSAVIVVLAVVLFCFPGVLFDKVILGPIKDPDFLTYRLLCRFSHWSGAGDVMCLSVAKFEKLQILTMGGPFVTHIWISFLAGLICGVPYVLWELWRFISPALKPAERRSARGFVFYASALFTLGLLFGYYVVAPLSVNFLMGYNFSEYIENKPTLDNYISFITTSVFAIGLVFELPIIVYFLTRVGMLTPGFMRKYRRHALVVILIIAALITPSPDMSSQLLVAIPLYVLYEASIFVSARVIRRQSMRA
jgi:sec-independent protein translocase protein TatC